MQKRYISVAAGLLVAALLSAGVCAAPLATPAQGIDVSHYDEAVDFAAVKASGRSFAFIKATEGETWNDSYFTANRQGAATAGVLWGPYHFFRAYSVDSAQRQAEHFWAAIKGTGYTLKPVVDVETADGQQRAADVRVILQAFLDRFQQLSGVQPIIYSYTSYINEYGLAKQFSSYTLWQADYRDTRGDTGWDAAVWQYSESGHVPGVTAPTVDLNVLYDDSAYVGGQAVSAPGTISTTPAAQTGDPTIRAHQAAWNSLRIYPSITEDGLDGPQTRTATKALQWLIGITQDSVWGTQTQAAYQAIVSRPTLRQGDTGKAVRYVQIRVGTSIDGKFGPDTRAAVIAWQRAHGLEADGIVGADTWAALLGG